jgi:hypothetical protein
VSLACGWVSEHHVICVIDDRIGYMWRHERIAGAAVLGGSCCLSATVIPADDQQWHLTSAGWPAAPEDYYP